MAFQLDIDPGWLDSNGLGIILAVVGIILTVLFGVAGIIVARGRIGPPPHETDPTRLLSDAEQKARKQYLQDLRRYIKHRLDAFLHNALFIHLGIADEPSATHLPWLYRDTAALRTFDKIEAAFEDEATQRRLLILGAPGSGA